MRFRAANSTILLVTGIAAFVQSAGSIGESLPHAAVAAVGIALAVVAGWLQLPVRSPVATVPDAAGPEAGTADEATLAGQIAVTTFVLVLCYFVVFLAGLVTVDYSAYLYGSGARPTIQRGVLSPGSPGASWEWALPPGADSVTTFDRADDGSPREQALLGNFAVTSCGALEWTLSTDGDRPLSRGTIPVRTRQRVRIPLPDRERSTTLRLTLRRTDTEDCTAVFVSSPLWAVGRPRIPLPGLGTYIESSTR